MAKSFRNLNSKNDVKSEMLQALIENKNTGFETNTKGDCFVKYDTITISPVVNSKDMYEFVLRYKGEDIWAIPMGSPWHPGDVITLMELEGRAKMELT